jgi:hypothetical protein
MSSWLSENRNRFCRTYLRATTRFTTKPAHHYGADESAPCVKRSPEHGLAMSFGAKMPAADQHVTLNGHVNPKAHRAFGYTVKPATLRFLVLCGVVTPTCPRGREQQSSCLKDLEVRATASRFCGGTRDGRTRRIKSVTCSQEKWIEWCHSTSCFPEVKQFFKITHHRW